MPGASPDARPARPGFGFALLCTATGLALIAVDRGVPQCRWWRAARWSFAALAAELGVLWLLLLP